jgi:hypothetical protein
MNDLKPDWRGLTGQIVPFRTVAKADFVLQLPMLQFFAGNPAGCDRLSGSMSRTMTRVITKVLLQLR